MFRDPVKIYLQRPRMHIRKLTENDAHALWHFRKLALETDPFSFVESPEELDKISAEEYASRLRPGAKVNFIFGAFEENHLIGTVGFYQETHQKRCHKGWIWGVFVRPDSRGTGIAHQLMLVTIQAAKEITGLDMILLTVSVSQKSARHLYESLGFRSIGIEPRGIKVGVEAVDEEHMVLDFKLMHSH